MVFSNLNASVVQRGCGAPCEVLIVDGVEEVQEERGGSVHHDFRAL